jgi:hypothetical protein
MITDEYQAEMKRQHAASIKWGSSAVKFGGHEILGYIEKYKGHIGTVLDYGCGKGVLAEWVNSRLTCPKPVWTKYDPGIPGIDELPEGRFDMVITCDVLEHVEPTMIDDTIRELEERAQICMYNNIACATTNSVFTTGPYAGQNVHINVQNPQWWLDKFTAVTATRTELYEYKAIERRAKNGPHTHVNDAGYRARCVMLHERVG